MTRRMRTRPSLRAILSASVVALVPAAAAQAACTTSSDGLTRTCTGSITGPQSFNHTNLDDGSGYTFVFEALTSTALVSSSTPAIQFQSTCESKTTGSAGGAGGGQTFRLNLDAAASGFQVRSQKAPAIEIQATGGNGGTNGEKHGSGNQHASNGGAGGAAGTTTVSITDTGITANQGNPLWVIGQGGHGGAGAEGRSTGFGDGTGGNGGKGENGGTANINLTQVTIANTGGGNATVLEVSRRGGAGGTGGTGKAADYTGQGGPGGVGGAGGAINVSLARGLSISGPLGTGILLSSPGAAGGNGGNVSLASTDDSAITIAAAGSGALVLESLAASGGNGGDGTSGGSANGGPGGQGGTGGSVTVSLPQNVLTITTTGTAAQGIFARSYGGAGGDGGRANGVFGPAHGGAAAGSGPGGDGGQRTAPVFTLPFAIAVGGSDGISGDGGTVEVTNSGTAIRTGAADAVGIFAQSVGGGGGTGGNGLAGAEGTVSVGGTGGADGDGGAVTVTHSGGIATGVSTMDANTAAHGILAQSIGGGGGYAGSVVMGPSASFGSGLVMADAADSRGDGCGVSVSASGDITTLGGSSVGIFAQSVGGGGVAGAADAASPAPALIGNGGGLGTGGAVSVAYGGSGSLTTSGTGAHGIFAQSAGGTGSSTTSGTQVSVEVSADVSATGAGAHGIFAQSVGDGMGAIAVTVAEGATVTGGGAATIAGAEDGAGIFVKDGTSSTITNAGTITSVLGSAGVAINAVGADLTLDNSGTITGEILKASSIRAINRATGLIDAGPLLDVDRLTNRGTLAVGLGAIRATLLTGDLVQGPSGVLAFELDPSRPQAGDRADRLDVGGSARLDGRAAIRVLDPWQPEPGRQSVSLITAAGGLAADGLAVTPSVVAQYRLERRAAGAIGLSYDIDFANPGILAATNANQDRVARHLHGVYRGRALDDDIALTLIAIERAADYAVVMNTLGAEVAVDNQIASLFSAMRFGDALLSCAERTGAYRFLDEGRCGWLGIGGQRFERDATGDNLGFDVDSWQIAGGGHLALDNGWHIGGALSYEHRDLSVRDSRASSDGRQFLAGVSARRRFGATELSGSFALGYGDFDIDRDPLPGVSLAGSQRMWLVSGQLRAAHLIERERWTLVPRIDLGVDYLSMDGFRESGDGGLGLQVDASDDTYVHLQPAIDIGAEFETEAGVLIRPRLTLGVTQFLGDATPAVTGRFAAAPSDVGPFTAGTGLDRTRFDLAAGLDILARGNVVVRAEASAGLSRNSESYAGALSIEIPF